MPAARRINGFAFRVRFQTGNALRELFRVPREASDHLASRGLLPSGWTARFGPRRRTSFLVILSDQAFGGHRAVDPPLLHDLASIRPPAKCHPDRVLISADAVLCE